MEQLVVLTHSLILPAVLQLCLFFTFSPHIIPFHPQTSLQSVHIYALPKPLHTLFGSRRMDAGRMDGWDPNMRSDKVVVKREALVDYEEQNGYLEEHKKKKGVGCVGGGGSGKKGSGGGGGGGSGMRCCQAEKCNADLHDAKQYHRRHRVCEYHAKAQVVLVGGMGQRFCQQCSRFHELAEFDDTKRSCRRRLAGHNERRRKNSDSQAEGSSRKGAGPQLKDLVCGQVDDRGRIQITIQENAAYKHFQIR